MTATLDAPPKDGLQVMDRRQAIRILGKGIAVAAAGPSLWSCTPGEQETAQAQATLNVLNSNVAWSDALTGAIAEAYREHTGGRVSIVGERHPYENHYEKLVLELSSGSPSFDLVTTDNFWCRQLITNSWVVGLDGVRASDASLPEVAFANLAQEPFLYTTYEGSTWGLPLIMTTPVFVYRRDLFEAAGISEVPRDWDAYREAAAVLHSSDRAGCVLLLGGQDSCVTEWIVRMAGMDEVGPTDDNVLSEDNVPVFNENDRGERAIELIKEVLPYAPAGVMNLDYPDAVTLMTSDSAAMLITWTDIIPGLEEGFARGNLGYTIYPVSSVSQQIIGGWSIFINANSANVEEAYRFLSWMAEGQAYELMREAGESSLVLRSDLDNEALVADLPMLQAYRDFEPTGTTPIALPPYRVTNADQVQRILFEEIQAGVTGAKTARQCMLDAESRVSQALQG